MTDITTIPEKPLRRPSAPYSSLTDLAKPFYIDPTTRSYRHQYANIYFVRLVELRNIVERAAAERWKGVRGKLELDQRPYKAYGYRETTFATSYFECTAVATVLCRRYGIP